MRHSAGYTFFLAAAVCVVCGVMVSSSAVLLADKQAANAALDKMKNVLTVSGLAGPEEELTPEHTQELFTRSVRPMVVDLKTGERADAVDPQTYDQRSAQINPKTSFAAPENRASVKRLPEYVVIYEILDKSGQPSRLVLPIEGYGLWSTLYGFLALDTDLNTIKGISYYQHGETAGLGGEVDNPKWKALWPGRKVFDDSGKAAITVIKGAAGPASSNPYEVNGLSGATLTSNGVTNMLKFWLSDAYQPFLEKYGAKGAS